MENLGEGLGMEYRSRMQRGLRTRETYVPVFLYQDQHFMPSVYEGADELKNRSKEPWFKRFPLVLTVLQETWMPKVRLESYRLDAKVIHLLREHIIEIKNRNVKWII